MHLLFSLAHGSHLPPQPSWQLGSTPHAWPALQPPQMPPGIVVQNSSHFTTQTVFLTSFISHTTWQRFSHVRPQWQQRSDSPQLGDSTQAGGDCTASAAIAVPADDQPRIKTRAIIFI
jgi:deferrochelatase/peroxidase EfeB